MNPHMKIGYLILAMSLAFAPLSAGDEETVSLGIVKHMQSTQLGERRTLNVYLPVDYARNTTTKYPVIYLLDGAVGEDYHHVTGLIQFLTVYQLMPPSIVVGIANVNRYRDFASATTDPEFQKINPAAGGSPKFRAFLAEELKPYVNKTFRSNGTDTLIGQSLGGLVAAEIFYETPSLFDLYMIVSPSFWWDNGSLIKKIEGADLSKIKGRVFLCMGEEGKAMQEGADRFVAKLKKDAPSSLVWDYLSLPEETHATVLHRALYRGFEAFYSKTHPGL